MQRLRCQSFCGLPSVLKLFILLSLASSLKAWDSDELEIFDLVEEINENFYTVMGLTQDASLSDVKRAYRTLSKQLHPDKNDAPDAEVKFREMVAVYEVLKDENRRARYDRVLVEGLPDWRSPIYYYRRARKMSIFEICVILTIVISITQYLMAWGSYLDKKHTMEEFLCKKFKIKDRRKQRPEDLENRTLMEEELSKIPRPRWWNILPVQLVQLVILIVTQGPSLACSVIVALKEDRQRKLEEKIEEEEEEKRLREEEEKRKERKAQMKTRKRVQNLPDRTGEVANSSHLRENQIKGNIKPAIHFEPIITGGPWTDDDFCELARLMAKFPGGTSERWEKIASQMNRTVFEVTKMSSKVMTELMNRNLTSETSETSDEVQEPKVKQKTKGGDKVDINLGADELWSVIQQKSLEKALKQFPKGTDQRWDKIARFVPEKSKEDCMMRFKYLAEKIKKKREEKEREPEETESHYEAVDTDVDAGEESASKEKVCLTNNSENVNENEQFLLEQSS
ncbi:hypothetical protein Avbf_09868 [Armadillidium vulgare]|nr:hypothetical protein Avbf_09868 [Armadillidium vulgare]